MSEVPGGMSVPGGGHMSSGKQGNSCDPSLRDPKPKGRMVERRMMLGQAY